MPSAKATLKWTKEICTVRAFASGSSGKLELSPCLIQRMQTLRHPALAANASGLSDPELLKEYAQTRSEGAFNEIVRRHVDFVYSAALRQSGSHATAQDVTQVVFIVLARKASALCPETVLAGWLFRAVRYAVRDVVKTSVRRQRREQEAAAMQQTDSPEGLEPAWEQIAPLLDESLAKLPARDRDAILLRYFKNLEWAAVGAALGLKENAARVRAARALEKIRTRLVRRGVTISAVALGGALLSHSVQAAPASWTESIASTSLTEGGETAMLVQSVLRRFHRWRWRQVITGAACVAWLTGFAWFGIWTWHAERTAELARAAVAVPAAIRAIDRAFLGNDPAVFLNLLHFRSAEDERFKPVLARFLQAESFFRREMGRVFRADQEGFDLAFRELCVGQPAVLRPYLDTTSAATNVMIAQYPMRLVKAGPDWKWDLLGGLPRDAREARLAALQRKAQLFEQIAAELHTGLATNLSDVLRTIDAAP
jgi:RNA polymerase sigma factor (sigma-70 family)